MDEGGTLHECPVTGSDSVLSVHYRLRRCAWRATSLYYGSTKRRRRAAASSGNVLAIAATTLCAFAVIGVVVQWRGLQSWHAVRLSSVESDLQQRLEDVGQRLRHYSMRHDDAFVLARSELVNRGIVSANEWSFTEPTYHTKVIRLWAPVTPDKKTLTQAVIVEHYDGRLTGCRVLYSDCIVALHSQSVDDFLNHENARRKSEGLSAIPRWQD